ncbi:MAG: ACP S-malonyltransferase [Pseudomonadota bacterium]|uniref:Malonyl CoA-acyl carrier protein transacylase n=1 Tax=Candidatus Desulfatibia profunda TaxID=2841695 RepID=A0A8J6NUC3_9BACT|nr:ACP S-malonyltransferase [Candidatus Desulfatibia profunda]MBL7180584.1 ACP S-malonyltransferase [Desulfobacterales bacterium]MBU0697958.1 ACP S-malonyltransferase [Pseudomonadota bacterium]
MKKTVFLFPGQGSQAVGMGQDFYQEYDFVREIFDMAAEAAKLNLSQLCFQGPFEDLTMTINLQPAITVVNLACLAAIEKEGITPDITAGHSLGEYSALCASGVLSKMDTFKLVFKRGWLMHRESTKHPGAMQAIVGLPIDAVQQLVDEVRTEGVVAVANHNTELQIVITGAPDRVKKISSLAESQGAKTIPLKVSGAWHSDLIKGAEGEFKDFLSAFTFAVPQRSILMNVTGDFAENPEEIRSIMAKQLCSPVRWYDAMCKLVACNVEYIVEVGPGKVLTGLLKKILPKDYPCKIFNVNNMKSLESYFKEAT